MPCSPVYSTAPKYPSTSVPSNHYPFNRRLIHLNSHIFRGELLPSTQYQVPITQPVRSPAHNTQYGHSTLPITPPSAQHCTFSSIVSTAQHPRIHASSNGPQLFVLQSLGKETGRIQLASCITEPSSESLLTAGTQST